MNKPEKKEYPKTNSTEKEMCEIYGWNERHEAQEKYEAYLSSQSGNENIIHYIKGCLDDLSRYCQNPQAVIRINELQKEIEETLSKHLQPKEELSEEAVSSLKEEIVKIYDDNPYPDGAFLEKINKPEDFNKWNKVKQDDWLLNEARTCYIVQCAQTDIIYTKIIKQISKAIVARFKPSVDWERLLNVIGESKITNNVHGMLNVLKQDQSWLNKENK